MSLYKVEEYHIGTHRSHCCIVCGCKYGSIVCPVVLGVIKQDDLCDGCEYEGIKSIHSKKFKARAKPKSKQQLLKELNQAYKYCQERLMKLDFEVMRIRDEMDEIQSLIQEYKNHAN